MLGGSLGGIEKRIGGIWCVGPWHLLRGYMHLLRGWIRPSRHLLRTRTRPAYSAHADMEAMALARTLLNLDRASLQQPRQGVLDRPVGKARLAGQRPLTRPRAGAVVVAGVVGEVQQHQKIDAAGLLVVVVEDA